MEKGAIAKMCNACGSPVLAEIRPERFIDFPTLAQICYIEKSFNKSCPPGTQKVFFNNHASAISAVFGIEPCELRDGLAGARDFLSQQEFCFCSSHDSGARLGAAVALVTGKSVLGVDAPRYKPGYGHWITVIKTNGEKNELLFNVQLTKRQFERVVRKACSIPGFAGSRWISQFLHV